MNLNILQEAWALPGLPAEISQNLSKLISWTCSWKVPSRALSPQHSLSFASFPPTSLCQTGCSHALTWSHLGCRDNKKPCLQPTDQFTNLLGHPSTKELWGRSDTQLEPQEGSGRRWGRGASSPAFPLQGSDCRLRGSSFPNIHTECPRGAASVSATSVLPNFPGQQRSHISAITATL